MVTPPSQKAKQFTKKLYHEGKDQRFWAKSHFYSFLISVIVIPFKAAASFLYLNAGWQFSPPWDSLGTDHWLTVALDSSCKEQETQEYWTKSIPGMFGLI